MNTFEVREITISIRDYENLIKDSAILSLIERCAEKSNDYDLGIFVKNVFAVSEANVPENDHE